MIITSNQLLEKLHEYSDPFGKIKRMVKKEELFPLTKGLYEDNIHASGFYLAGAIYGPSYISFNSALSYYGLIPEAVYSFTSATTNKLKKKQYHNRFGTFTYRDIPLEAFPYGIETIESEGYYFRIATKEKALCDKLYELPLVSNQKELEQLLFEDMRIYEDEFIKLDRESIYFIAPKYHSTNVSLLEKYLRRKYHE